MNKQQIISTIKAAAIAAFGSENCYGIQKATGLSYMQINNVYAGGNRIAFETIIKMTEAVNLEIDLKQKQ